MATVSYSPETHRSQHHVGHLESGPDTIVQRPAKAAGIETIKPETHAT
ncbi:MAG: hypothetical protein HQ464_12055 [Planctomycetes bacterium]|nr:hypothetical protein [Planctomycetota bacterium]